MLHEEIKNDDKNKYGRYCPEMFHICNHNVHAVSFKYMTKI